MYHLKLKIDLNLLVKQIDDMAKIHHDLSLSPGVMYESVEGVINLLTAIRDQIEPNQKETHVVPK